MIGKKRLAAIATNGIEESVLTSLALRNLKWFGKMNLHLLNEQADSWLAEIDWPLCSGKKHYVCASTGLVFNKETGREVRYSSVSLDLSTIEEKQCTEKEFRKWKAIARAASDGWRNFSVKPGPKPKSSIESDSEDFDDWCYV